MWNNAVIMMLVKGTGLTLYMTLVSTVFAYIIGLPMGIALVVTAQNGLRPNKVVYKILEDVYKRQFVNEVSSLEYIYGTAGKAFGVVSLDNISVEHSVIVAPDPDDSKNVYVYTDKTVKPDTVYNYKVAANVAVEKEAGKACLLYTSRCV